MPDTDRTWIDFWIDVVADRSASMSQRRLSLVERNGGAETAVSGARVRGLHLANLTNDKDNVLIAASMHTFEPLC